MGDIYPRFIVAAVQAAPVLFDRDKTTDKAIRLIEEAADKGAAIIGFPECYIPGLSRWSTSPWLPKLVNPENGRIRNVSPHSLRDCFAVLVKTLFRRFRDTFYIEKHFAFHHKTYRVSEYTPGYGVHEIWIVVQPRTNNKPRNIVDRIAQSKYPATIDVLFGHMVTKFKIVFAL